MESIFDWCYQLVMIAAVSRGPRLPNGNLGVLATP